MRKSSGCGSLWGGEACCGECGSQTEADREVSLRRGRPPHFRREVSAQLGIKMLNVLKVF